MPITAAERTAIDGVLSSLNDQLTLIVSAREDVTALLRIAGDINNNAIEDSILASAKLRGKTAAQAIVTLLT